MRLSKPAVRRAAPYVLSLLTGAALAGVAAMGCASSTPSPANPKPDGPRVVDGPEGPEQGEPKVTPGTPATQQEKLGFAAASNAFGIDLYRELKATPGNMIMSPASISMAMAMPWLGAHGKTGDEIKKVFHFGGTPEEVAASAGKLSAELQDPKRPLVLRIANRLYGEKTSPFEAPFLELAKASFGAPLEAVDFRGSLEAERVKINQWVLEKTEKKIADLMPAGSLDPLTRLVIVNAVYFKGDWDQTFPKGATQKEPFFASSGEKQASMMHAPNDRQYSYTEGDGLKALAMSYKGGSMSMVVVLPDKRDGLPALEASLTTAKLDGIIGKMSSRSVNVSLPKFRIAPPQSISLGAALVKLGMPTAFDDHMADFTGVSNPPNLDERLHIDKVFHKAFIEVDEKGTEAAAATGIGMAATTSVPPPAAEFIADHPFLFLLRDNASGLILFMGRVEDPS